MSNALSCANNNWFTMDKNRRLGHAARFASTHVLMDGER